MLRHTIFCFILQHYTFTQIKHMDTHAHTPTPTPTPRATATHTHIHIYIHTYIYIYIYTNISKHLQTKNEWIINCTWSNLLDCGLCYHRMALRWHHILTIQKHKTMYLCYNSLVYCIHNYYCIVIMVLIFHAWIIFYICSSFVPIPNIAVSLKSF